ncbi:copper resistance protein [Serratia sp. FDAARGOS_506]|uniref:copper resistance protein n=1 Tax=Serratia sp. FDAARGOS_506 TaxID=2420306 RepID=UPI000F50A6E0|nr:copper resistance protein [Serratia sp. FDAARGOS_506]AYZ29652.1 copper resistance protein [Serratia sp. FDAARGOS_506]HAT4985088.1 copper resistance protein [Serratia marcescens]HAT5031562.1 copper resistance protein [Serratia marcescens]
MVKRQQIAKWFLCLACLVVLTCMTQRMAGLHALQQTLGIPAATAVQSSDAADGAQPTPCELSAKSLLAAPPVMFETVLFGLSLLLALLAPTMAARLRIPPPRAISPPTLRVHLRLCVFRE